MTTRSDYGAALAALRQKVKDARAQARTVRAAVLTRLGVCRARHKQWKVEERARHRATLNNARAQLKLTEQGLRQRGQVEALLTVQNAIDALQALRDDHTRARMDRARKHADAFRESEAGIAYMIDGDPMMLDVWKRARADVRKRYEASRARGLQLDPVEAWAEYLKDNSSEISEAKARIHHTATRDAELEMRDLVRQWKAGTLDESLGAPCKHERAVKSVDGRRRICPDCGRTIGSAAKPAATKKKRAQLEAVPF